VKHQENLTERLSDHAKKAIFYQLPNISVENGLSAQERLKKKKKLAVLYQRKCKLEARLVSTSSINTINELR